MDIAAESLSVRIGTRVLLDSTTLTCSAGTITALVGPSGCGKTTLLHCLGLLQRPSAGRVLVEGVDATSWSGRRRRRFWSDSAAFVLQDYGLIEEETVAVNVTMRSSVFGNRAVGDLGRLASILETTGLGGRERERVVQLSGGEKQRLALARALYKQADAVFVDEPTASLDAGNRDHMIDLLGTVRDQGRTLVIATHDDAVAGAANNVYDVLNRAFIKGGVVPAGSSSGTV